MSISDRLGQIERESVEANEQWDCGRSAFNADNHAPPIDVALANGERTLAALRAVLDLHKPMTMYEHEDCCENDSDDHREERHAEDVVHGGEFFCMDLPTGIVLCAECSRDLDFDGRDYPCPTVRAIATTLGKEARNGQ